MSDRSENLRQDVELVTRALTGDEFGFRQLVERYQDKVMACTFAITRNRADAADAAQEAFIRFHRNLAQFDPRRPLKPYLLRIAANCSKSLVAKRIRDAERHLEAPAPDTHATPEAEMLRGERKADVRRQVMALPETQREVTSLFYLAECSCREVAEILEMTESAVKVALHRARQRLYQQMRGTA